MKTVASLIIIVALGTYGLFSNHREDLQHRHSITVDGERSRQRIQNLESNGHVDNLVRLPADSEQFMMIEDLYKTTDKLNAHIEDMALNKVNIEFLRKQMDKVLEDIEKLKDANREMKYNGNGSYSQ